MCASRLPFSTTARRQGLQKAEHELSELWDGPCLVLLEPGGAGRGVVLVKQARGGAGIQHMALVGMVAAQRRRAGPRLSFCWCGQAVTALLGSSWNI